MKSSIRIIKFFIATLGMAVILSPLYVPLIYEPDRLNYYWYEIIGYWGAIALLLFIFNKLDKDNL